ncbi:hypothetical protein [Phytomonospora endophytica]|uniref:Uncharacterized protein n=1 Tax=Phytomonospora endophytica TaxID=714109 RepID=A0A841FJ99_9ACTN|nr:hypothetical protein [Phytomonospora endophytica]MBB6037401.1 hypothetical protein [Phytomonospora endophytica]GIG69857.1 hypothetical protein Pen01_61520 [Phytomonospora endophytica]
MRPAILVIAALLALTACASSAAPPATAPTPPADVATAEAAYWTAWSEAQATADGEALDTVAADPLLTSLRQAMREKAARDEVTVGPVTRTPAGAEQRGTGWAVASCVDFDAQRDTHTDGTAATGPPPDRPTTLVTVVLRPREGGWRAVGLYFGGECG